MKFDKQLASFLYETKRLPLQGIGEFFLDEKFVTPPNDVIAYPQDGIGFIYSKKTVVSDELKQYLKSQFSKPISLIASDLEDYILQIDNWLNIGKAYTIEGIGTLNKLKDGTIEFSVGTSKVENISSIVDSLSKKESEYRSLIHKTSVNKGKVLLVVLGFFLFFGLAAAIWALWPMLKKQLTAKNENPVAVEPPKKDTPKAAIKIDTPVIVKPVNDTVRYKMFFLASKYREKADKIYLVWSKYTTVNRDSIVINDTLRHRLFIYKRALPSDTVKVKQQLEAYFNHAISIEPAH